MILCVEGVLNSALSVWQYARNSSLATWHFELLECELWSSMELLLCFVSAETVCSYHTAGMMYGQPSLVLSCIAWLEKTLLPLQSAELLQNIR